MDIANIYSVPKIKNEVVGDIASRIVRDLIAWTGKGNLIRAYLTFCTALEVNKIGNAIVIKHVVCHGEQPSPIDMPSVLVEAIIVPLDDGITISAILNNGTKLNFKVYDYDALMVCRNVLSTIGDNSIDVSTIDLIHYISDYNYEVVLEESQMQNTISLSKNGKLRYVVNVNSAFATLATYSKDQSMSSEQVSKVNQLDVDVVKDVLIPIARLRVDCE